MSNIHNNGENDQSLHDGLDKLDRVYGQLERDEPPKLLDQAILNSAHRAVEKKPHWMKFSWLHGLTTAAVFVLAFSIILNQREPVPEFENDIRNNEAADLQQEKVAGKQAPDQLTSENFRMEKKAKDERRQVMPKTVMPVSTAKEFAPNNMAEQAVLEVQSSLYVRDDLQAKTDRTDKDAPAREIKLEEAFVDEVDVMANSPQEDVLSRSPSPALAAEPEAGDLKARSRTESEAELRLLAIIKLKQSGNERWEKELELFKESYPGYPLPTELTK